MVAGLDPGPLPVSLAECKAYLRLERVDEDALLAGFIRTAMALCEAFIGQQLLVRSGEQRLAVTREWQRILVVPVVAITGVFDAGQAIGADRFETDIDVSGGGWVQLADTSLVAPTVSFRAGLAVDWNGIPEPIRQGLVRLVAHLFSHRDAADAGPPPAAVAAMWRPWRRVRLG